MYIPDILPKKFLSLEKTFQLIKVQRTYDSGVPSPKWDLYTRTPDRGSGNIEGAGAERW